MEDEIRKSRTDCVYFLASPLTCKKGSECEYRHSENARINPRDCWYWLNGNCRNSNCPFRHPLLEGFADPVPNSAHFPPYSAVSTSKPNVPCYFFFNAYCIKGNQCPFLHDISLAQNSLKAAPEPAAAATTTTSHPLEHKSSTESHTGPASVEIPENPPEGTPELIKQYRSKEVQQSAHGSVTEPSSPSGESSVPSVPECEEPAIKLPDSPVPPVEYEKGSNGHFSPDQSSEELVKEHVEPDEWWESSPGFDVLVDDGSDHLPHQEDAEYLLAQGKESEMLHSTLLKYDFEGGSTGYDPIGHPDASHLYNHSGYDSYDHLENRYTPEYFQGDFEVVGDRFLKSMIHQKRKLPCREREVDDARGGVDLRNHLRKRRRMEVRRVTPRRSRKCRSSRARGNSRERPTSHGMGLLLHGQNLIGSSYSETESVPCLWRGWPGYHPSDRHDRSRHRERREGRRRHAKPPPAPPSEISQGSVSKEANSTRVMTAGFTGPKTLAQIREEKSRAKGDNNGTEIRIDRRLRGRPPTSGDFAGPKPLNELLKDKGKVGSVSLKSICSQAEKGDIDAHLEENRAAEEEGRESESNFSDDDDDGLRKKLAHILSR